MSGCRLGICTISPEALTGTAALDQGCRLEEVQCLLYHMSDGFYLL